MFTLRSDCNVNSLNIINELSSKQVMRIEKTFNCQLKGVILIKYKKNSQTSDVHRPG